MTFVTCVRPGTHPKNFEKLNLKQKSFFVGLWKNASHTIYMNEKTLIIDVSCTSLF